MQQVLTLLIGLLLSLGSARQICFCAKTINNLIHNNETK